MSDEGSSCWRAAVDRVISQVYDRYPGQDQFYFPPIALSQDLTFLGLTRKNLTSDIVQSAMIILLLITMFCAWFIALGNAIVGLPSRSITGSHQKRSHREKVSGDHCLTFVVDVKRDGFQEIDLIRSHFPKDKWREVFAHERPHRVDCIFGLTTKSSPLYHTRAKVNFRLDADEITDKVKLHMHLMKSHPTAIAPTRIVDASTEMKPGQVWMVRANWGWGGKASGVATSTQELQELRTKFSIIPDEISAAKRGGIPKVEVIASDYIRDPYLWKQSTVTQSDNAKIDCTGRKFHTRMILTIFVNRKTSAKHAILSPIAWAISAGKPFVDGQYQDEEIHDSHEKRAGPASVISLLDMDGGRKLYDNAVATIKEIAPTLNSLVSLYPEAEEIGYDVFGLDIMHHEDGRSVLIEINKLPGVENEHETQHRKDIISGIFISAVAPTFDVPLSREDIAAKDRLIFL